MARPKNILYLENIISEQEKQEIISMYQNNISLREIEKKTTHGRNAITKMLERLEVKTQKGNHYRYYFCDFNFFATIDSELKAYWLGLLYADGAIISKRQYGEQEVKLSLGAKDLDVVENFKKDLQSTYPIRYDDSKNKKNPNAQIQVIQCIRSQKMVDDLKDKGCVENKSLILQFPNPQQVPSEYIYDFIRGYFDGDGSISFNPKRNSYLINIVGAEDFIKKLSTYFEGGSIFPDKRKTNSWYFSLGGNLQVLKAYHLLYDNKTRYMKRKYNVFQDLVKKYSEN